MYYWVVKYVEDVFLYARYELEKTFVSELAGNDHGD
jgi:hypothetical protein